MENKLSYSGTLLLKKLKAIYQEHGRIIICYDFDDTVFNYSNTHEDLVMEVIRAIRRAKRYGNYVYVYTDLHKATLEIIEPYLQENDIPYDSINECLIPLPFGNAGKPYYNILLDDKAGLSDSVEVLNLFLDYLSNIEKKKNEADRLASITPGACQICTFPGKLVTTESGGMYGSNVTYARVVCTNCTNKTKWETAYTGDNIKAAIANWHMPVSDTTNIS